MANITGKNEWILSEAEFLRFQFCKGLIIQRRIFGYIIFENKCMKVDPK